MYKLGFDVDEVICKTFDCIREYLNDNFGFDFDPETVEIHDFNEHPLYQEQKKAFEALYEEFKNMDFFKDCDAYERGVRVIKNLYKKGHHIYFISNRPQGGEEATAKWLRKHSIPFHKILHAGYKVEKGFYGRQLNLDFYVDDRPEDIESMLKYKNKWSKGLFLFDKPWNRYYNNDNVKRISDWDDIFNTINIPRR